MHHFRRKFNQISAFWDQDGTAGAAPCLYCRTTSVKSRHHASGFQPESHRTVIDQGHLHVDTKTPARHGRMRLLRLLQKMLKQPFSFFRRSSGGKSRARAFAGICRQRELGNQQQPAPDISQAAVHFTGIIRKYAIAEHAFQQPVRTLLTIITLHADEHQ